MKTKRLLIALASILISASALKSQEQPLDPTALAQLHKPSELSLPATLEANSDTVIVNINDSKKVVVIERDSKGRTKEIVYYKRNKNRVYNHSLLFEIGLSNYNKRNYFSGSRGDDDFLNLHTSKSVDVAIYPIYGSFRLTSNRMLELETGLGINWTNYRFEDGWTIENNNGVTVTSSRYRHNNQSLLSKSKLVTVYMNVPLMLKLNIPIGGSYRKSFHLSAGLIGGMKIGSHTKVKFNDGGRKEKDRSSFNLNLLKYDLRFRAGYRGMGIYFNYQMTPMFEKSRGPELYPYSVGLSFTI